MEIEFDPAKDALNVEKHGLTLALAEQMDMTAAVVLVDDRANYGETRFRAFGPILGRLCCLVFTVREDKVRVISLRKANARERRLHGSNR